MNQRSNHFFLGFRSTTSCQLLYVLYAHRFCTFMWAPRRKLWKTGAAECHGDAGWRAGHIVWGDFRWWAICRLTIGHRHTFLPRSFSRWLRNFAHYTVTVEWASAWQKCTNRRVIKQIDLPLEDSLAVFSEDSTAGGAKGCWQTFIISVDTLHNKSFDIAPCIIWYGSHVLRFSHTEET